MSAKENEAEPFASRPIYSDVYPLDEFYALRGQGAPVLGRIDAGDLPEPYRTLLVHQGDMTSRLENFHQGRVHIKLLARRMVENEYFREVTLNLNGSEKPVEFGAIKIILDLFPMEARQEILEERQPLGRILGAFGIVFASRPRAFFHMASDDFIEATLHLEGRHFLYGRRNTLVDAWERPLAEIVEILPP